jgi:hypothetical protein
MVIGWIVVFAGGVTLVFNIGPWFFFGALALSDLIRTRFEPRIPREVERRRRWILLPLTLIYLGLVACLGFPESPTHPIHLIGGIGFAAGIAWLIRDDIRVYRQLHEPPR